MELKQFVSETMKQIIDGVIDAQKYAKDVDAKVNPYERGWNFGANSSFLKDGMGFYGQILEFDVAVTTTEGDQVKGGAGIFVGPVALGTQGQAESQNSTISRIKFSVPIVFPYQKQS